MKQCDFLNNSRTVLQPQEYNTFPDPYQQPNENEQKEWTSQDISLRKLGGTTNYDSIQSKLSSKDTNKFFENTLGRYIVEGERIVFSVDKRKELECVRGTPKGPLWKFTDSTMDQEESGQ